jgi:hypothetical protein
VEVLRYGDPTVNTSHFMPADSAKVDSGSPDLKRNQQKIEGSTF